MVDIPIIKRNLIYFPKTCNGPRQASRHSGLPADAGIKDEVIPSERDQGLLLIMASAAVSTELGLPAAQDLVRQSMAGRPLRAKNYAAL